MFTTFINAFKIKDLRKKILYTLLLIVVYRLGCAIPIPGIDTAAWAKQIEGLAPGRSRSRVWLCSLS